MFRINAGHGQHLLESPLATDQQVRSVANQLEVSATVVESDQLRWWLRGFGKAVTVFKPARLLDE